jgi:hypothetical protein
MKIPIKNSNEIIVYKLLIINYKNVYKRLQTFTNESKRQ